jgi:hypothetical protein
VSLLVSMFATACGNAGLQQRPDVYGDSGDSGGDGVADSHGPRDSSGWWDTSGETGGGGSSNAGKTGGLAEYQLIQIACPDCLGYTSDLQVVAMAGFHAPTKKSWVSWIPSEGSCATDPNPTPASDAWEDAGEWLSYRSGATSVQLRQADGLYSADGLDEGDFIRNAAWEVDTEGGNDVGDFAIDNAFYTPESISELEPMEMLYTRTQDAFAARIPVSRADFTWGPSGGSDQFAVVLDVYNQKNGQFLGEVFCLDADAGSLRVPAGYLSGYPSGSLLVIGMYRYVVGSFVRPDDESTVETVVNFGVIGTGVLAN